MKDGWISHALPYGLSKSYVYREGEDLFRIKIATKEKEDPMKITFEDSHQHSYRPLRDWLTICLPGTYVITGRDEQSHLLLIFERLMHRQGVVQFRSGQVATSEFVTGDFAITPVIVDEVKVRTDEARALKRHWD